MNVARNLKDIRRAVESRNVRAVHRLNGYIKPANSDHLLPVLDDGKTRLAPEPGFWEADEEPTVVDLDAQVMQYDVVALFPRVGRCLGAMTMASRRDKEDAEQEAHRFRLAGLNIAVVCRKKAAS